MACHGSDIAKIYDTLNELQRIVKSRRDGDIPAQPERKYGYGAPAEVLTRQIVIRATREAQVIDPTHARIRLQELCNVAGIFDVAIKPDRGCLNTLEQKEGAYRR